MERPDYDPVLIEIERQWATLTRHSRDGHHDRLIDWRHLAINSVDGHLDDLDSAHPYILYMPHDFVSPGGRFPVQFYWDSYFIVLALLGGRRHALAKGMVDNALFMVERHGFVTANRKRWSAGSQLPFLAHMVRGVYEVENDKDWLQKAVQLVEAEYFGYWLDSSHLSYRGLSRYHAPPWYPAESLAAITIDNEATWDLSPRFTVENVLSLLPIDLNSNLLAYETHLASLHRALKNEQRAIEWDNRAAQRGEAIQALMWDNEKGLYRDFNFKHLLRSEVLSLATFFPLFHGQCSEEQAARVMQCLWMFEAEHGLKTCDRSYGYADRQWNTPIGWAPLHYIAAQGMRRYGYDGDADRVERKWLDLVANVHAQTGFLYEKYDVVRGTHDVLTDRYSNQRGFGWTNAVFALLAVGHGWEAR